jgi:hypothetical protein
MSPKTIIGITGLIENEFTEEDKDELIGDSDNYDTVAEFAEDYEKEIESIIENRVFGEADNVDMKVEVEVEE